MDDIERLAQSADFIVNGYAFICQEESVRIVNLHDTAHVAVLDMSGKVIESSMHDIETNIVQAYWAKNRIFSKSRGCADE